jgi:hypothetical protein
MSKKIIILNGSPRANGNTSALTAQFKAGAEEAGNEVTEFHLSKMKIDGCLGCWHGGEDPEHPCVQRDDMEKIYPVYREADVVVLYGSWQPLRTHDSWSGHRKRCDQHTINNPRSVHHDPALTIPPSPHH